MEKISVKRICIWASSKSKFPAWITFDGHRGDKITERCYQNRKKYKSVHILDQLRTKSCS